MLEQRAAQGALKRVNRPVHADVAGVQLGSGLAQVTAAHEHQEHFEFFQGEFFVDQHGGSGLGLGRVIVPNIRCFT
ncbi:hypothetical protein D3C76_725200 [compost metagenome]